MKEIINARFQKIGKGGMGVVIDTRYVRCFWPFFKEPTPLFTDGSRGIEVEGPPTPRNIIFPSDTKFLGITRPDCFFIGAYDQVRDDILDAKDSFNRVEILQADADDIIAGKKTVKDIAKKIAGISAMEE